ncbi:Rieske (2Fe-2S) protein [Haloferacaceae archaeon DSL9]
MTTRTPLTPVEEIRQRRSWLFTAIGPRGDPEEIILVPCDDGVEAWVNRCTHESQRLDRGFGAAMRDGSIICPKHGSMFDSCSGYCDNGEAAQTTLVPVEVAVDDGEVYLVDDDYAFSHEGEREDDDGNDGPSSTSHLSF